MTHESLIVPAAIWLQARASIVITEMTTVGEEPDAIGFNPSGSILVEVKVTRADFLRDGAKFFRREPKSGMGNLRYYFCPKGLLREDELPEKWGLVEFDGVRSRVKKKAEHQGCNARAEQRLLISAMRRIGAESAALRGLSVKAYTYQTKSRATLGIEINGEKDER